MPSAGTSQSLDTPLIKVPYESLRRSVRERKYIVDGVKSVVTSLTTNANNSGLTNEERLQDLDKLVSKLTKMKRKLTEMSKEEEADAGRCVMRLQHLISLGHPLPDQHIPWNKKRLDVILVDHLLRSGYHVSATNLASEAGIQNLVDTELFKQAQCVVQALKSRDCGAALAWCASNKSRLNKLNSNLEFKLRVQEFIELVRRSAKLEAIMYARQYLSPWAASEMQDLQRAMTTLAFQPNTDCFPYMVLFDVVQWDHLTELFLQELYRLNSLTPTSVLQIHLQAGLSALKTPSSFSNNHNKEDPLSMPEFKELASGLPMAKHGRSKLMCSVTKEMMNEHNPPMVMPNGYVYSQQAVMKISAENDGKMVCPITGVTCSLGDLKRAYLA